MQSEIDRKKEKRKKEKAKEKKFLLDNVDSCLVLSLSSISVKIFSKICCYIDPWVYEVVVASVMGIQYLVYQ